MQEIKLNTYKGTRILLGNEKRSIISSMCNRLFSDGFTEISIPIIQNQELFFGKVGEENNNLMFNFTDRGGRNVCLAPEYTAVVQKLSKTYFKQKRDFKLFYVQECFRGEKPQAGRYRQFTQLGVEILNPTKDYYMDELITLAKTLLIYDCCVSQNDIKINDNVVRGLDYYKNGRGFEISCDKLGAAKQICGGGEYDGGIGFAIGVDRVILI